MTPAVLYRDEAVLVIDKPAGLPVHRGPRGGASVEDLLESLRFGKRRLPQPAHRLDADTAGCLVLGRTKPALAALGRAFAEGAVEKVYWAVVRGGPTVEMGEIALPVAKRSTREAGWRMVVDPAGAPALTLWRVLGRGADRTWLELRPRTGRTHQLRVHCAAMGWPILGDAVYGAGEPGGLALLARSIAIPSLGVAAEAPVPAPMQRQGMGWTTKVEGGPGGRPSSPRAVFFRC
ncbi:RluA family pseudouridine synthase [Elioraea tepidiphila]|uniref:RluA family pseudouridine synthase n=2 Tax=Elioraea tepidiphila TaxID=457934 RepID=UPI0003658968|nr:RNA pseudouridine synthase [Elioraea tepidiphila]